MSSQTKPKFRSPYADILKTFYEYKQLCGLKYNTGLVRLNDLDNYLNSNFNEAKNLSLEDLSGWLTQRKTEGPKNFASRFGVYHQLYLYCMQNDISVFPDPGKLHAGFYQNDFVPYIYTHDEIRRFMKELDADPYPNPTFQRCAPLFFRILYGTGLRSGEALSLRVSDVVQDKRYLTVRKGKYDNSRIVPYSDSLAAYIDDYINRVQYANDDPLFKSSTGRQLDHCLAYDWFRRILWKAGIPHPDKGNAPRMHDFRHTFAVHSLQNAVANGTDPNAFLPILRVYLGHRNLAATEQYLRLTSEMYPQMQDSVEKLTTNIIPEVTDYED